MAIEKKLIHFSKLSDFETQLNAGNILDYSIVFIQDAKKIWTHSQYYDCNGGNETSDSPTFLRIGDADDEAKANFIAVVNGEKSADYYICASSIQDAETNGIVSSLVYSGPSSAPIIEYTFYGAPMSGSKAGKLLKINTILTVSTSVITTTYEDVLDAKQDTITDLETIREGAAKGATSVQSDNIATVATSGSYKDLTDKPVYITDFDVLSLNNLLTTEDGALDIDSQALENALAANKIVLVPYEISDNTSYRGYATLVGYAEDLLYFKVITDSFEIDVETLRDTQGILSQEVTLRMWSDKQDKLISGTNIKTINGNSLIGSGNINLNQSAVTTISSGTIVLSPNISLINHNNLVAATTIVITPITPTTPQYNTYDNVWSIRFSIGSTVPTISFAVNGSSFSIIWANGTAPTFEAGKIYEITFKQFLSTFLGVCGVFSAAS